MIHFLRTGVLVVLLGLSVSASAAQSSGSGVGATPSFNRYVPVTGSYPTLGKGWTSLAGSPTASTAVQGTVSEKKYIDRTRYELRYVATKSELARALDVNVEASVGFFGAGAEATYKLLEDERFDATTLAAVVIMERDLHFYSLDRPQLTDAAVREFRSGKSNRFYSTYGDSFVSEIAYGCRAAVVIYIKAESFYRRVDEKITAAWKFPVLSGSANIEKELRALRQENVIDVRVGQLIGLDPATAVPDADDLQDVVAYCLSLPRLPTSTAAPVMVTVADYSQAEGKPDNWRVTPVAEAQSALRRLADHVCGIQRDIATLDLAIEHPEYFIENFGPGVPIPPEWAEGRQILNDHFKACQEAAHDTRRQPSMWGGLDTLRREQLGVSVPIPRKLDWEDIEITLTLADFVPTSSSRGDADIDSQDGSTTRATIRVVPVLDTPKAYARIEYEVEEVADDYTTFTFVINRFIEPTKLKAILDLEAREADVVVRDVTGQHHGFTNALPKRPSVWTDLNIKVDGNTDDNVPGALGIQGKIRLRCWGLP